MASPDRAAKLAWTGKAAGSSLLLAKRPGKQEILFCRGFHGLIDGASSVWGRPLVSFVRSGLGR